MHVMTGPSCTIWARFQAVSNVESSLPPVGTVNTLKEVGGGEAFCSAESAEQRKDNVMTGRPDIKGPDCPYRIVENERGGRKQTCPHSYGRPSMTSRDY